MANGNDRTPALQNEDWWACFIGWFILLVAIIGVHEVSAGKFARYSARTKEAGQILAHNGKPTIGSLASMKRSISFGRNMSNFRPFNTNGIFWVWYCS